MALIKLSKLGEVRSKEMTKDSIQRNDQEFIPQKLPRIHSKELTKELSQGYDEAYIPRT